MSIIVEDGTGLSTAESFLSVADSLTYHAARGNNTWATLTTAQQEQALRRASDYMEEVYRLRWSGYRKTNTQALSWPRYQVPISDTFYQYNFVDSNTVPVLVKNACAELALRAAAGELYADLSQGVISEQVGPLKVDYDKYSPQRVRYAAIDALLRPYFSMGGASVGLMRA